MRELSSRRILLALLALLMLTCVPAVGHDFGGPTGPGGAPGGDGCPGCCGGGGCGGCGGGGDPVNYWDGAERYYFTDLLVGGYMPLAFARSYDSRSKYDGALGYGWSHSFNYRLYRFPDGRVMIRKDCGARREFLFTGGAFVTPPGERGTLVDKLDGTYEFREGTGYTLLFDAKGRLTRVSDRAGNYLQLTYDPGGRLPITGISPFTPRAPGARVVAYDYRLTRVEEFESGGRATGRYYNLAYDTASGRLRTVTDHSARTWYFMQDASGNLVSAQDPLGNVIAYSYTDPGDVHNLTVVSGGPANVTIAYDAQDRVTTQSFGDVDLALTYAAPLADTRVDLSTKSGGTVVASGSERWEFGTNGLVARFTNRNSGKIQYPSRNAAGQPLQRNVYEFRGGADVLVEQATYTYTTDGLLQSEVISYPDDPKTVTRTYTYDAGALASLSEYDNAAPTRVFYRDWLHQKDGTGTPLWVNRYRRRNNPGAAVAAYDELTMTHRTNGTISGITYPGGATSTIDNVNGYATNVDGVVYARDQRGNILSVTALGRTVSYTYDALDRVKTVTTPGGNVTTYTYTGLLLTQAAFPAYTIDYAYDPVGRLTSASETRAGTVKTLVSVAYDKAARTVTVTDAQARTYTYPWDPLRVWQRIENPDVQNPLPSIFPNTRYYGPAPPDPVAQFFKDVLNQPGVPIPVTQAY